MRRVLVVDDDPDIRAILRLALEMEDYIVETVNDGAAALEWLTRANESWIVMMDINMPRMSGLEVCAHLTAVNDLAARHVVVLMTAGLFPDDDLPPPARAMLSKPFDLDLLRNLIASLADERPDTHADLHSNGALSVSETRDEPICQAA